MVKQAIDETTAAATNVCNSTSPAEEQLAKSADLFDLSPMLVDEDSNNNIINNSLDEDVEFETNEDLHKMSWFHGKLTRAEAEALVVNDGDFLVRESKQAGQYVLTGMEAGNRKHLLLVDPEGVVSFCC